MPFNDKIEHLFPIATPAVEQFYPQTIGWKIAAGVLCLCLFIAMIRSIKRFRKAAYRREANRAINSTLKRYQANELSEQMLFLSFTKIMKSTAMQTYGRNRVAGLSGNNWAEFLQQSYRRRNFTEAHLLNIIERPYKKSEPLSKKELKALTKRIKKWIGGHRG